MMIRGKLEMGSESGGGGYVEGRRAAESVSTTGSEGRGWEGRGCGEGGADAVNRNFAGVIVATVVVVVEETFDASPNIIEVIEPVLVDELCATDG